MYTATVFLFLSMPLVPGSVISFAVMFCYLPIIVKRIENEEQLLTKDLPDYGEYTKKVRYRLIPFIRQNTLMRQFPGKEVLTGSFIFEKYNCVK